MAAGNLAPEHSGGIKNHGDVAIVVNSNNPAIAAGIFKFFQDNLIGCFLQR